MSIDRFILNTITRAIPAEVSHKIILKMLQLGGGQLFAGKHALHPSLQQNLFGINFQNPLSIAAGFDKNATAIEPLFALGFGAVEIGSVTLKPQSGNQGKRLFRLHQDRAVINRLGLPSLGAQAVAKNLHRVGRGEKGRVVGINIAYNGDSSDIYGDYRVLAGMLGCYADYITVNVSCPNVGDGKDLQSSEFLPPILQAVKAGLADKEWGGGGGLPVLLKLSPDTAREELHYICDCAKTHGVAGLIVGNTTLSRPAGLRSRHKGQAGGLSGKPLFDLSTRKLAETYLLCGEGGGGLPLVGVGGIASAEDAYVKIKAGASLLQLYSGLVYGGVGLIAEILDGLPKLLAADGYGHVRQAVGCEAERWANSP